MTPFVHLIYLVLMFASQQRSMVTALIILIGVVMVDIGFHDYLVNYYLDLLRHLLAGKFKAETIVDMGFAPEVWLSVLSLTLGTLIIIISIASQTIPKLIDFYMEDWVSLFYVWFLIISSSHAVFTKFYNEIWGIRVASAILNIHFFLPISVLLTLPYIFYILKSTQPSVVISKIFSSQLHQIRNLRQPFLLELLKVSSFVGETQSRLFKSLSQLDNLLEYVSFKEAKAQIIQDMSTLAQEYVRVKSSFHPDFFRISPQIKDDISFRTMMGNFSEIERTRTFYEQKCFRLLGNTYTKLIEEREFDLASLCGLEITRVGLTALEYEDVDLLGVVIVRFNTMLRFALKHGVRNNEARNLYNLVFHYRNFITNLVKFNQVEPAKKAFFYLRVYGTEIFKHGRISPSMYFIVDVFAAEMKEILILVNQQNWDASVQLQLLQEMLLIDNPPDFIEGDLDRGQLLNNGVRIQQIGLCLYYLKQKWFDFVNRIINDILEDMDLLGESAFRRSIEVTMNRLTLSTPFFWEDTDRGSLNLYYTPYLEYMGEFREMLYAQVKNRPKSPPNPPLPPT